MKEIEQYVLDAAIGYGKMLWMKVKMAKENVDIKGTEQKVQ